MQNAHFKRFTLILLGSVLLHLTLLGGVYGNWIYHTALKWGSLEFGSDGDAQHLGQLEDDGIDRGKPLILPKGFYAVHDDARAQEEQRRRERERIARERAEKVEKERLEREKAEREQAEREKQEQAKAEDGSKDAKTDDTVKVSTPTQFGKINGGAFKPHIQQVYAAYERGTLEIDTFSVAVSCRAMPDGSLADIRLTQSSGNKMIDQTAMNLFRELSDMKALGPLSSLSSLSLTLAKDPQFTSMTATGFAATEGDSQEFATQLGLLATAAKFKTSSNPDQAAITNAIRVSTSGARVSVSVSLPNSQVAAMMQRSFSAQETAQAGT